MREAQGWCLVGWGSSHGCLMVCSLSFDPALIVHAPFRLHPWSLCLSVAGPPRALWMKLTLFPPHPSRGSSGLASSEHPVALLSQHSWASEPLKGPVRALTTVELLVVSILPAHFPAVLPAKSQGCRLASLHAEVQLLARLCTCSDGGRTAGWALVIISPPRVPVGVRSNA